MHQPRQCAATPALSVPAPSFPAQEGAAAGDYAAAVAHIRAAGPSAVDAELRLMTLGSPDAADLRPEDEAALAVVLEMVRAEVAGSRSFELLQAFLAAFLRVHGEAVAASPALRRRAAGVRDTLRRSWGRLDSLFQEVRCTVGFLGGGLVQ